VGVLLIYFTIQQAKVNGEVCTYNEECVSEKCTDQKKCAVRSKISNRETMTGVVMVANCSTIS
jgi:hypothetical protein